MYKIKKGLDLPISGGASGAVQTVFTQRVGILGPDYLGMKPTMLVKEGEQISKGQKIFEDKKNPGVFFTSPISGKVSAIQRGEQRSLLSVVIERQGDSKIEFEHFAMDSLENLTRDAVVKNLIESGLWTSLRTRPYSKIPAPNSALPNSIFVNAMDTNPLAIDPSLVINEYADDFIAGLLVVSKLTTGKTFVCKKAGTTLNVGKAKVDVAEFCGPHPSGLVGTHIHMLDPVYNKKTVWHLNYQDTIAIGKLFLTGELDLTRVISIAGPAANKPKFVKTDLGADLTELLSDQKLNEEIRVINGSVFSGAKTTPQTSYLGKYALQVSLLEEGTKKEFIGWMMPGTNKFSAIGVYLGAFSKKLFKFTTSSGGSPRSIVPIGVYERIMPLNILITLLIKSIVVKDTDMAQQLGVLELDEEDMALCTFVCPSKYEYGAILRENLEQIEMEG